MVSMWHSKRGETKDEICQHWQWLLRWPRPTQSCGDNDDDDDDDDGDDGGGSGGGGGGGGGEPACVKHVEVK